MKNELITIHRGASEHTFPCNSSAAVYNTWVHKVIPEIDVRVTKDEVAVVFHDESLQNECAGRPDVKIEDLSFHELEKQKLCSGDGIIHRICQLEQLFVAMKESSSRQILLDLKTEKALPIVQQNIKKTKIEKQIYVIAYSSVEAEKMKTYFPNSQIVQIVRSAEIHELRHSPAQIIMYCGANGLKDENTENFSNLSSLSHWAKMKKKTFGLVYLDDDLADVIPKARKLGMTAFGISTIEEYKKISSI